MATTKKTASKATKKSTTKRVSTKRKAAPKKAETRKAPAKKPAAKTKPTKNPKPVASNPYRPGSHYATCFDCLAKMGNKKPVSRKDLLTAYCEASGKDEKHAKYDLAVVLSPTKEGEGHRSSRKEAYWVERLADGLVQLHMAE